MEIKRFSLKMIVVCWLALGAICCCWWSPALALDRAAMAIYNDKLTDGTQRGVWQGALTANESMLTSSGSTYEEVSSLDAFSGAQGAGAGGDYSEYSFTFNYTDGSGDKYSGYVYAPTLFQTHGDIVVGTKLYNQPIEMGGGALGGYYDITAVANGYDATYDCQSYITSYYDGDTGKTSYTLYSTTGGTTATNSIHVADRRYTAERGYVYDPAVPASDDYFGSSDVCYDFSTGSSSGNNFLAQYVTDIPYWNQPTAYSNSCAEVASALILSYWDRQSGYSNLITTDWQTLWPDDTADTPASYGSLIGTLAEDLGWTATDGTYPQNIGPGMDSYAASRGYADFQYINYDLRDANNTLSYRTTVWQNFTAAINAGRPVELGIYYYNGGDNNHGVTGRGYWNDGDVVVNMGWGTSYMNYVVDWYRTTWNGTSYEDAYVYYLVDFQ